MNNAELTTSEMNNAAHTVGLTGEEAAELAQGIKVLMDGWNTILEAAKKEFPEASEEEIYQIAKSAMNHTLKIK